MIILKFANMFEYSRGTRTRITSSKIIYFKGEFDDILKYTFDDILKLEYLPNIHIVFLINYTQTWKNKSVFKEYKIRHNERKSD